MKNEMTVSVAMAAYNGEKYISKQLDSILMQLKKNDELVISINPSTDETENVVRLYQKNDCRIRVILCEQKGVLANFENAIRHCKNDIIFLSDQDDVWRNDKIEKQLNFFTDSSIGGVCHGCRYIDCYGNMMDVQPSLKKNRMINFWDIIKKNPVQGSTLAFRRELATFFIPFPKNIPMHDSWIGLWICKKSNLIYCDDPLLFYRQHDGSVTVRKHKKLAEMLIDRTKLLLSYCFYKRK